MGLYINPNDSSKEQWLKNKAREVTQDEFRFETGTGEVPLAWVDNGPFSALAVAYSEREFKEFTRSDDSRPRKFYYASFADVQDVTDGGGGYDISVFEKK
jgi:hypothetical protein